MKISCDVKAFHSAVQAVLGIVPQRSPKPVLQNIKIVADKGVCQLLASDFDLGIRMQVDGVEVMKGGAVLIPGKEINDILKEARAERVMIEQDGRNIHVTAEDAEYKLMSEDPDEFPEIAQFPEKNSFSVGADVFSRLVSKTVFSVATEASRFAINGLCLTIKNKEAIMVGTDGKRLALAQEKLPDLDAKAQPTAIISPKGAGYVTRLLEKDEKELSIWMDETQILFRTRTAVLASRLIEGQYPNYQDVLPKNLPHKAQINRDSLTRAIRQAALTTSDEYRAVKFEFSKNKAVLSSRVPELGETRVEREIEYKGDDLKIGFDPRFVLDGLRAMTAETVALEMNDAGSAAVLKEPGFQYVIMPISIAE